MSFVSSVSFVAKAVAVVAIVLLPGPGGLECSAPPAENVFENVLEEEDRDNDVIA